MVELGQFNILFESTGEVAAAAGAERVAGSVDKIRKGWSGALEKVEKIRSRVAAIGGIGAAVGISSALSGGGAGAALGAVAGGIGGALIGSLAGPIGTIVGEIVGSIVGSVVGDMIEPFVGEMITAVKDMAGFNEVEKAREGISAAQGFADIERQERAGIQAAISEAGSSISLRRGFGVPTIDKQGFVESRAADDIAIIREDAQRRRNEIWASNAAFQMARQAALDARGQSQIYAEIERKAAMLTDRFNRR